MDIESNFAVAESPSAEVPPRASQAKSPQSSPPLAEESEGGTAQESQELERKLLPENFSHAQRDIAIPSLAAVLMIATTTLAHAIPWLLDGFAWTMWIGIALGMMLVSHGGWASSFWTTWGWSTLAIGAAFHWSPDAMAYTLSSGYALGFVVSLPLIIWDGLRLALGYWLSARLTTNPRWQWLAVGITATLLELIMPSVFPWKLGYSQLSWPWLIQAADLFGPSAPTFIACAMAGVLHVLFARTVWTQSHLAKSNGATLPAHGAPSETRASKAGNAQQATLLQSSFPAVAFLLLNGLYCGWSWYAWHARAEVAPKIDVALVQVDPSYSHSLAKAQELTRSLGPEVDLVCWPESSGGNYAMQLERLTDEEKVFALSREPERGLRPLPQPKCELLLGGKNFIGSLDEPEQIYVTAMLLDKNERICGRYNKRYLMPFGEYVPGEQTVPGLAALFDMAEHVAAGQTAEPIESCSGARIGAMLCYEDMVPGASRELVDSGANILVSLINGSAFESPYTLIQHRLLAQLRAVECRRYMVRCAATGESCVVTPWGSITNRLPLQSDSITTAQVGLLDGRSLYVYAPWVMPAICLFGLGAFLKYRKQQITF